MSHIQDIYASAPLRGLLADEAVAYMPDLRRCSGSRALLLSASRQDEPPNPPFFSHWVTLHLGRERIQGDVVASTLNALPFSDRSFDVVLLRHAFEAAALPIEEIIRLLTLGGTLVLTGLNPFSGWTLWWQWQTRGSHLRAQSPFHFSARLRRSDMQVERVQRVGRILPLPSAEPGWASSSWLGGGYVLVARKTGTASIPSRLRIKPVTAPVGAGLASGARRSPIN